LGLSQKELVRYARKIGSDVPFFIYNYPFAVGSGRGDKIRLLRGLKKTKFWHILVMPNIEVSTPLIYRAWDTYSAGLTPLETGCRRQPSTGTCGASSLTGLTKSASGVKLITLALKKKDYRLIAKDLYIRGQKTLPFRARMKNGRSVFRSKRPRAKAPGASFNNLEEVSSRLYPQIKKVREKLVSLGLKSIRMTGSGPAVFGVVSSRKEAVALARQLKRENKTWQIFVVKTI
jgi:4-diphosphocytidyl-2C-methyl-D-erythritol kinase